MFGRRKKSQPPPVVVAAENHTPPWRDTNLVEEFTPIVAWLKEQGSCDSPQRRHYSRSICILSLAVKHWPASVQYTLCHAPVSEALPGVSLARPRAKDMNERMNYFRIGLSACFGIECNETHVASFLCTLLPHMIRENAFAYASDYTVYHLIGDLLPARNGRPLSHAANSFVAFVALAFMASRINEPCDAQYDASAESSCGSSWECTARRGRFPPAPHGEWHEEARLSMLSITNGDSDDDDERGGVHDDILGGVLPHSVVAELFVRIILTRSKALVYFLFVDEANQKHGWACSYLGLSLDQEGRFYILKELCNADPEALRLALEYNPTLVCFFARLASTDPVAFSKFADMMSAHHCPLPILLLVSPCGCGKEGPLLQRMVKNFTRADLVQTVRTVLHNPSHVGIVHHPSVKVATRWTDNATGMPKKALVASDTPDMTPTDVIAFLTRYPGTQYATFIRCLQSEPSKSNHIGIGLSALVAINTISIAIPYKRSPLLKNAVRAMQRILENAIQGLYTILGETNDEVCRRVELFYNSQFADDASKLGYDVITVFVAEKLYNTNLGTIEYKLASTQLCEFLDL